MVVSSLYLRDLNRMAVQQWCPPALGLITQCGAACHGSSFEQRLSRICGNITDVEERCSAAEVRAQAAESRAHVAEAEEQQMHGRYAVQKSRQFR